MPVKRHLPTSNKLCCTIKPSTISSAFDIPENQALKKAAKHSLEFADITTEIDVNKHRP